MATRQRVVLALTGASGALYFLRTLRALLAGGHHVDVVMSKFGVVTLRAETPLGDDPRPLGEWLAATFGAELRAGQLQLHGHLDQASPIASGSVRVDGMAIVPCSMKTLAGVAHGASSNLIERAADVMLKERRRLILVPREAPYNLLHLRNMVAVTEAGGVIIPASPAFYQRPQTLDDLGDFIAARILSMLGIESTLLAPWAGLGPADAE